MKIKLALIIALFGFLAPEAEAQEPLCTVSGVISDASDHSQLIGATIMMINIRDSAKSGFAIADSEGKFHIDNLEKAFYRLKIMNIGYKPYTKIFRLSQVETNLGTIQMEQDIAVLGAVNIEGQAVPVQQIGDTTQYNAAAFKTNPDANASDLVKKMPGITVDEDGVTANGESIEQVLLDGKRFFGQDPLLSLNTIPAEIVDKVKVYDEGSDQSELTGFDDGNTTKTMNIITKKDKNNGLFGKVYAGYGTKELYKAGGSVNSFNKDKRITVLGMSNNINQQNFGSEDLAGISGSNRGGLRRGGNNNFSIGTLEGITRTNSFGLNLTDDWGKKITFEGNYFFNQTSNKQDQSLSRESFLEQGSQFYSEDQQTATGNLNHRVNTRLDYKINENNKLLLRSAISYQDNETDETTLGRTENNSGELLNITHNKFSSLNQAFNISNNLIYQHKFSKIGRTLSINANSQMNPVTRVNYLEDLQGDSLIEYHTNEDQYKLGTAITYTEPIGMSSQLALKYEINYTSRESDRETFTLKEKNSDRIFNEGLSNHFKSDYTTRISSLRYSKNKFGNHFDALVAYQWASLNNDPIFPANDPFGRDFHNILPSITGRFDFSANSRLFIRYATSTTEPSVSQLQEVIDNSNPLFLSIGNPLLGQAYTHSFTMRLQKNITDKNITFSNFTRAEMSLNYITNSSAIINKDSVSAKGILLPKGAQLSKPVNMDGYWSARNNTTFGILLAPLKSNFNTSIGLTYQRLPGITNDVVNFSNTYSADLKVGLVSNISDKIDYTLYYQIAGSRVFNSLQSGNNNQYYTQTLGTKLNLIFGRDFVLRNETFFQRYTGANSQYDADYILWNMGIAKKFLKSKNGELELSVFDLLGQNQSFDQTVNSLYLEETETRVLQQYFMLTFTYQIRHFK